MKVGIIGGAGHVGLPMGLVLTNSGHEVLLIDENQSQLNKIAEGNLPYKEPGAESLLESALDNNQLRTTTNLATTAECDAIIFVIGTPIDEHHNPQINNLLDTVYDLTEHLHDGQLLVFRSTVYPGTTAIVQNILEKVGFVVGEDIYISFAPERVAQHKAIEEIVNLPQLIGTFEEKSYRKTVELFDFLEAEHLQLRPTEAELGKLFTNMWRYLSFAAANEFYLIAESFADHHNVNIHRILEKTGYNYPRFDVPSPGANVGGPCLTKDGWFLADNIPYNELVSASYQINEGMPSQIIHRMASTASDPNHVTILGMTFKGNSDDTRNSVSFKLRNQLRMKGYLDVTCVEPNLSEFSSITNTEMSDWVILMTPHKEFKDLEAIHDEIGHKDTLYCDIWGLWDTVKYESDNGYFFGRTVQSYSTTLIPEAN